MRLHNISSHNVSLLANLLPKSKIKEKSSSDEEKFIMKLKKALDTEDSAGVQAIDKDTQSSHRERQDREQKNMQNRPESPPNGDKSGTGNSSPGKIDFRI